MRGTLLPPACPACLPLILLSLQEPLPLPLLTQPLPLALALPLQVLLARPEAPLPLPERHPTVSALLAGWGIGETWGGARALLTRLTPSQLRGRSGLQLGASHP